MRKEHSVPILLPSHCVTEESSLDSVTWQFGVFLSALEKAGIGRNQLPDDLQEIGALNMVCSGLKGNGSRTSLRNLVVLEGIEFTREFLTSANNGAGRLKWLMSENPFLAELEWLDFCGNDATKLLDDYDQKIHLLGGAEAAFFHSLKLGKYRREELLEPLTDEIRGRFELAEINGPKEADNHNARVYLYVLDHPELEIVPVDENDAESMSNWNNRIKECAEGLKSESSFFQRVPFLNRFKSSKKHTE